MVGIKGTGMTALAELLLRRGNRVSGSDIPEKFYTDEILTRLGVSYIERFAAENINPSCDLVIYSAAYNPETHAELLKAGEIGIPILSYPEALGELSRHYTSAGISGVHGKTTTTALAGALVKASGLQATVLAGSAVSSFGDSSIWAGGWDFFIAETCEYRRNFLHFSPSFLIITSVEPDHLDYFKDYEDILSAFIQFGRKLPLQGVLIYCADEPGAVEVSEMLKRERPDLRLVPYGFTARGDYKIESSFQEAGFSCFTVKRFDKLFKIPVPGEHTLRNAAAALALITLLWEKEKGVPAGGELSDVFAGGLSDFKGSRRRSEILGEAGGVLFMDDYAHHPTALETTLRGLRQFYPQRRIVADFMSHTYSRTKTLFSGFASAFSSADLVVLHKIYPSAREKAGEIDGEALYRAVKERQGKVFYYEEIMDALPFLEEELREGDLFITLGAGNNWILSKELYNRFRFRGEGEKS